MRVLFFIIIVVSTINVFSSSKSENNDSLVNLLRQYQPLFIELLNDTIRFPTTNISRQRSLKYFKEVLPELRDIEEIKKRFTGIPFLMLHILTKKNIKHLNPPENNWWGSFSTGYIEDERFFRFCVKLFKFGDIKSVGYKSLLNHSRTDYLKKYDKEIREGIQSLQAEKSRDSTYINRRKDIPEEVLKKQSKYMDKLLPGDELLIMLPLSSEEKKKMLEKIPEIPRHQYYYLRARLGDKKAEEYFIEQFENAKEYNKKKKFAEKLGIIGTPDCARALVKALNSPIRYTFDVKPLQSVRIEIIKALGRIHPEAPFLRMDITYIETYTDILYGGSKKIVGYLERVISWAVEKYKVKPVDKNPGNFLFPRKGGIIADPGPRKLTKDTPSWNVILKKNNEK